MECGKFRGRLGGRKSFLKGSIKVFEGSVFFLQRGGQHEWEDSDQ